MDALFSWEAIVSYVTLFIAGVLIRFRRKQASKDVYAIGSFIASAVGIMTLVIKAIIQAATPPDFGLPPPRPSYCFLPPPIYDPYRRPPPECEPPTWAPPEVEGIGSYLGSTVLDFLLGVFFAFVSGLIGYTVALIAAGWRNRRHLDSLDKPDDARGDQPSAP